MRRREVLAALPGACGGLVECASLPGTCCEGAHSTYHVLAGRTRDLTGTYVDREGNELAADAGELLVGGNDRFGGPATATSRPTTPAATCSSTTATSVRTRGTPTAAAAYPDEGG